MTGFEHCRSDSSLGVLTPEGIEVVLYPAGFPIRACAWAIDSFIQGVLIFAILITVSILNKVMGIWFFLIVMFVLDWFYHTAFEVFNRGQSPGKRIMGIRVVRGDGSPVNPGAAFLRNLLRFADTFMFLYLIALICMLVSRGFRRFGDWVADTLVVYTDHAHSPGRFTAPVLRRPGMPWLADVPVVAISRKLKYEEKQALLTFARRYPLLGKARADEIAKIWTPALGAGFSEAEASASAMLLGLAHNIDGTLVPGTSTGGMPDGGSA